MWIIHSLLTIILLITKCRLLITSAANTVFKHTPDLFYHSLILSRRQKVCTLIRLLLGPYCLQFRPPKCIRTTIVIYSEKRANHYLKLDTLRTTCCVNTTLKIITSTADGLSLRVHFKFTQKFVVVFCFVFFFFHFYVNFDSKYREDPSSFQVL